MSIHQTSPTATAACTCGPPSRAPQPVPISAMPVTTAASRLAVSKNEATSRSTEIHSTDATCPSRARSAPP